MFRTGKQAPTLFHLKDEIRITGTPWVLSYDAYLSILAEDANPFLSRQRTILPRRATRPATPSQSQRPRRGTYSIVAGSKPKRRAEGRVVGAGSTRVESLFVPEEEGE